MNTSFFSNQPQESVTHGSATFDLPVHYYRDDLSVLFYTADLDRVTEKMPTPNLHPVRLPKGRTLVGFTVFNYIDTSIGPYGEIGIVVPVVYGTKPPPPILPALLETRYPGFGALVLHLPVTGQLACDAGRGEWGYTKFVADMDFSLTPEFMECRLEEDGRHILTARVEPAGLHMNDCKPIVTYSVRNQNLIQTTIPQKGSFRLSVTPSGSHVTLGDHPVADSVRALKLGKKPLLSRYYTERWAILPSGKIIEKGVAPLDGYPGGQTVGRHTVSYTNSVA